MTEKITPEERNNAIIRIQKILNEYEDALKSAQHIYEDAVKNQNIKLQKEIQKKIEHIKKEEASIQNVLIGIKSICN